MKAMVVSPVGGRVPPTRGVLHNGLGLNGNRRDMEAEEVAAYLTKLRSLVPDMPRKRKLSKLEVIQRVIEYICDLQTTLEETNVPERSSQGHGHGQGDEEVEREEEIEVEEEERRQSSEPLSTGTTTTTTAMAMATSTVTTTTPITTETSPGVYQR